MKVLTRRAAARRARLAAVQDAAPNDIEATTFGWDTAFAIRIDDVNKAIQRQRSSPAGFVYQEVADDLTIKGTFGDWQICLGGDGDLVHMKIPIPQGEVLLGATRKTIENLAAAIEVILHYIPHTDQPAGPTDGVLHNLVVKHTSDDPKTPAVTVLRVFTETGEPVDFITRSFLRQGLQDWLNENIVDFKHVFATVNLNRKADKGQFQWLLPTYTSYAYVDRTTIEDSLLGVLCMTGGRPATGLIEQLSVAAIPDGSRAGFLIARERFLEEMLLPAMPVVYPGVSVDNFSLSTDGRSLVLNDEVKINDIQSDGQSYAAQLKELRISISSSQLQVESLTKVTVSPGIYAYCRNVNQLQITLGENSAGEQTLAFQQAGDPSVEHWTEKSEGVIITEAIMTIIAAVVGVVITVATDGAGIIVSALLAGLLIGEVATAADVIAVLDQDDAPAIDLLAFNSTDPITWSDAADFALDQAGLNGALQLGGNPNFAG